jgi:hypothetical protein
VSELEVPKLQTVEGIILPQRPRAPRLRLDAEALAAMGAVERRQALELMQEWSAIAARNPLQIYEAAGDKHHLFHMHGLRPGGKPLRRVRLLSGGNRAGKTTTAVVDSLMQMVPRRLLPDRLGLYKFHDCELMGPFQLRVVVPDMKRTGAAVTDKWREWVPKELYVRGSWERTFRQADGLLQLDCGCMLELLSCEMDIDKFGGVARDRVQYDEVPREAYRTESKMRLTDRGGDEVFSMTPLKGLDFTYRDVWKKRDLIDPDTGKVRVFAVAVGMRDNQNLSEDNIAEALAEIKNPAERRQRELGEFAELGGSVYPHLANTVCAVPSRDDVARFDEVIVTIDPGARFSGLIVGGYDRDIWSKVFAAAQLTNADVEQVCRVIRRVLRTWGLDYDRQDQRPDLPPIRIKVDPNSRIQRSIINLDTYEAAMQRHDMFPEPAMNAVEEGIQETQERMRLGTLQISEALQGLLDELTEYAWDLKAEDDGEARPKKGNDHRADALRYFVMARPWAPEGPTDSHVSMDPHDVATPPDMRREEDYGAAGALV